MASIVFAAVSFSTASYLFKEFGGDGGYGEKMRRHNLAVEELARAREKWNEDEIAHRDKLQELRLKLSDSNKNINDTNKALEMFSATLRKRPQLADYYSPSPEMQKYLTMTEGIIGVGIGWIGYKTSVHKQKKWLRSSNIFFKVDIKL